MAFSFVQTQTSFISVAATTGTLVPTTPYTQGDLVVVNIRIPNTTGTVTSISDDVGNTYSLALGTISNTAVRAWQYYAVQTIGGASTITVAISASSTYRISADEFSGNATSNGSVFDKASSSNNSSAVVASSLAISPASNGELVVAGVSMTVGVSSITAGSGYSIGTSGQPTVGTEYKLSSTTSENAPFTWTTASGFVEIAGAYLPGGAVTLSDTVTTTESLSHYSDLISTRESVLLSLGTIVDISLITSDSITSSELVATTKEFNLSTSDTITTNESIIIGLPGPISVSDSSSIGESLTVNIVTANSFQVVVSDTASTSENQNTIESAILRSVSDTITPSESVFFTKTFNVRVSDSTTLSEIVSLVNSKNINISETVIVDTSISILVSEQNEGSVPVGIPVILTAESLELVLSGGSFNVILSGQSMEAKLSGKPLNVTVSGRG